MAGSTSTHGRRFNKQWQGPNTHSINTMIIILRQVLTFGVGITDLRRGHGAWADDDTLLAATVQTKT